MKCSCGCNMKPFESMPTRYGCEKCRNECLVRDDGAMARTNSKGDRFTPSLDLNLSLIERIEAQLSSAD